MSKTADAIIIGGGVMGCSIQYNLAEMGMTQTHLLEKNVIGSGSTSRSQAILRMHYSNEVTARMAWESLKVFQNFQEILGSTSGYTRTGYLLVVGDEDSAAMRENLSMQRELGIDTDEVTPSELSEICPMVAVLENEVYSWEPQSGYADPYSVTTGYARRSRELGCSVEDSMEVRSIEVEGSRVVGVRTDEGLIYTDKVVVAAGPWSGPMLKSVGVDLHLKTVRHQVVLLRRPDDLVPEHPSIGDVIHDLSVRPDVGGLTMIGVGEDENIGPDEFNQGVDMPVVARAFENVAKRIPGLATSLFRGGWSGLFTTTPDWHPVLDAIEGISGLYVAVGFSGHGFKLSPMVGKVMGEILTSGYSKTIDVSALNAKRLVSGAQLNSRYGMQVLA
ncbi:MAG: FAD-binding oxidoreductase [Chloroflexota bacterium]|nr:FAD-binding oxidoreductase [Chloroflexota bacterium]